MPRKCKKLLPWLIRNLDERFDDSSKGFLGLEWKDRRNGLFWLPWPRQMTRDWDPSVSRLFLEYAKLQNRYNENVEPDYVKWKTRLRTALNKDSCVQEIKDGHRKKEHRKLYKIIDYTSKSEVVPQEASSPNELEETVFTDDFFNSSPSSSSSFDSSETSSLSPASTSENSDCVQALFDSCFDDVEFSMLMLTNDFEIRTTELENPPENNEICSNSQLTAVGISEETQIFHNEEGLSETTEKYFEHFPTSPIKEVMVSEELPMFDNEDDMPSQLYALETSPLPIPYT